MPSAYGNPPWQQPLHFRTIGLKLQCGRGRAPERIAAMGLSEQLAAFKAEFARTAPAGHPPLYEARIELPSSFARKEAAGAER